MAATCGMSKTIPAVMTASWLRTLTTSNITSLAVARINRCRTTCTTAPSARNFTSTSNLKQRYGFIGLGRMGFPMARNLRQKINPADSMIVHDVNLPVAKQFAEEVGNVEVAETTREVAERSEIIVTALPEPQHVKAVYGAMLEPQTLLSSAQITTPRLFIDTSTIDPMTSADVARLAHNSGQGRFVDAPMSGGVVGASAGTLTFMIGAEEEDIARVTEVLSLMGKRVVHLGPPTSGLKGKLANNYLLALNNVATCEAMNMGVRWGLDPHKLADMINTATGRCWPSEVNNPVKDVVPASPASRQYTGGFGIELMLKDLRLALKAGEEIGIKPGLGNHAEKIYSAAAADDGCKGKDFSVVYRYIGGKE